MEELIKFIREETRSRRDITEDTRIVEDIGCYGDDFFELMEKYSKNST